MVLSYRLLQAGRTSLQTIFGWFMASLQDNLFSINKKCTGGINGLKQLNLPGFYPAV